MKYNLFTKKIIIILDKEKFDKNDLNLCSLYKMLKKCFVKTSFFKFKFKI